MTAGTMTAQTAPASKIRPSGWTYWLFVTECFFCLYLLTFIEYEFGLPRHEGLEFVIKYVLSVTLLVYLFEIARRSGLVVPHGAKLCVIATGPVSIPILWLYVRGWRVVIDVLRLIAGGIVAYLLAYGCAWGLYLLG